VGNSVAEQLIALVFAKLPEGTATGVGRRALDEHGSPPRVVAIPLGAPVIRQPDRIGEIPDAGYGRILLVREFAIEWHCHGAPFDEITTPVDFVQAEDLYLDTMRAVRNITHHNTVFSDERWHDQEEGNDSHERQGTKISFMSTINLPVYAELGRRVRLTATPPIDTTVKLNDEEIDDV